MKKIKIKETLVAVVKCKEDGGSSSLSRKQPLAMTRTMCMSGHCDHWDKTEIKRKMTVAVGNLTNGNKREHG